MTATRVVVIGGGLAGLFTASELLRSGIEDILVLDEGSEPGGLTRTIIRDGFSVEPAAGTLLLPHPHLSPILEAAGTRLSPASPRARMRYVFTGDGVVALPSSPKALFAPLVPLTAKLRGAMEPLVAARREHGEESLDSLLRRRLGDRLGGMVAWLAASGVFAGDPKQLSARSAFPAITNLEIEAGSIVRGGLRRLRQREPGAARVSSHLPVGGMSALVTSLADPLGDRLRGNAPVSSVHRHRDRWVIEGPDTLQSEQVILAVSPSRAAKMVDSELAASLSESKTAPVVVMAVGGPIGEVPVLDGFGVLTGPGHQMVTRGILFESSYAPDRAPTGHAMAKVIAGGAPRPEVIEWDDDRLIETLIGEMSQVLTAQPSPSFVEIVRHTPGIPQYRIGHSRWLTGLNQILKKRPGLHLTGWGYRGVGVAHLATDAVRVREAVTTGI